ncbi:MAG: MFS transporter [Thermoproteus sp.]|nr:MFS transporter [Thermoproteus sp.]
MGKAPVAAVDMPRPSNVIQSGYYWGYSLAALTYSSLVGLFGPKAFTAYAWRYAFLVGLVVAVVGLLLRLTVPESELFNRMRQRGEIAKVPAAVLLKEHGADFWRALLVMSGLYWVAYATLGYLPTYLGSILRMPRGATFNAMFYAALIGGVLTVLGGALSDYVGRRRAFVIAGLLGIAAAYPLVLGLGGELAATAVAAGLLVGIVGMGGGVMLAFIAELFPTRVRGSAVGLLWNMANIGSTIALLASPVVTLLYSPALGYSALLVVGYSLTIAGALISRDATGSELK